MSRGCGLGGRVRSCRVVGEEQGLWLNSCTNKLSSDCLSAPRPNFKVGWKFKKM